MAKEEETGMKGLVLHTETCFRSLGRLVSVGCIYTSPFLSRDSSFILPSLFIHRNAFPLLPHVDVSTDPAYTRFPLSLDLPEVEKFLLLSTSSILTPISRS